MLLGRSADRTSSGNHFEARAQVELLADTFASMRFAPLPVLFEILLIIPLWHKPEEALAIAILATHLALSLGLAAGSERLQQMALSQDDVRGVRWIAAIIALACGTAGAVVPAILIPIIDGDARLVAVALTFGMVAFVPLLGAARVASLAFLAPVVAGAAIGAARTGAIIDGAILAALAGFGLFVVSGCHHRYRREQRNLAARLAADGQETMLALLPQNDPAAPGAWFWQTDEALRLRGVSVLLAAVAGWPALRLEGKPVERLFLGPTASVAPSASATALQATMGAHEAFQDEIVEHRDDAGRSVWWRLSGSPAHDADGSFAGYRGIGWDVSASYDAASRIAHLASHDTLTGLETSESFRAALARECRIAAVDGSTRAVLLLDLDGFKEVNGSFGHHGGDELLKLVAARLLETSPRQATVARLGSDEFAILYAPSHAASAEALARALVAAIRRPFEMNGIEVAIDVGIGIAMTPDHATDAVALFRQADLALLRAKAAGRGHWKVFAPEFEHAITVQRILEADIKLALAQSEFAVHFQPLIDLQEGKIAGFEALLRWTSPTRGSVSPADFIPAAEAGGLIIAIGRFVLLEACKAASGWREDARVAVNISPRHLRSREFMADVALALKMSGLPAHRLEIEITEGVFLDKSDAEGVSNLHALRAKGIRIALDDFGTGYSSLNYLTSFPVDKIKIDRSFITHLLDRHENRAVVDAILTLARKLGLSVVAEGVETAEQALALKIRRCNEIQGFLASKAQPAANVDAMFDAVPRHLKHKVPALFESPLAAVVAMRRQSAA